MRLPSSLLIIALAAGLAACAPKEAAGPTGAAGTATGSAPVVAGPRVIEITTGDNMKYSVQAIEATPGEDLKIILSSTSTAPKESMAHNLVLFDKDADIADFMQAAAASKADGFLPKDLMAGVIAHTKLLGGGQKDEVEFKAPMAPGEYPYFCTFPGHYLTGMHGTLTVKAPAGSAPAAAAPTTAPPAAAPAASSN